MPKLLINGVQLEVITQGSGIPIIFIHPPVLNHEVFTYQIKELSKHYQVIVFDIRGHGKSEASTIPLTYPLIVEDMKQILDVYRVDMAYICGFSSGGSIALEFLLQHPNRSLGGIIVGGMAEINNWKLRAQIRMGIGLSRIKAIRFLALNFAFTNRRKLKDFYRMYVAARRGNAKNIEQYFRYSLDYSCRTRVSNITAPVLLVNNANDNIFLPFTRFLHQELPNSELKLIQNSNHIIPTKEAVKLNDAIRAFINTHTTNK